MTVKKIWWISGAAVAALAVGTGTTVAVLAATSPGEIVHDPAATPAPAPQLSQAIADATADAAPHTDASEANATSTSAGSAVSDAARNKELAASLDKLGADPRLGTFGAVVVDATTGEVVWTKNAQHALTPASTTKVLTAAAALLALPIDDRLTTTVTAGSGAGTVTIKAAGDVMLTEEKLDELAAQIKKNHPEPVTTVLVDTSAWSGPNFLDSWDRGDIAAGFIAPMDPVMLYGARIGKTEGDVPRSENPALDVAGALAKRLGAQETGVAKGAQQAAAGQQTTAQEAVLASVESDTLLTRLRQLMQQSDNVAAEALGRELAVKRGLPATNDNAVAATRAVLEENGFDLTGVKLVDNSGMSMKNAIPPALLGEIMHQAVGAGAGSQQLRPLLETLPVAAASGTLEDRYHGAAGAGWVRGKTGTLTKTTGLAGTVQGANGRIYAYGFIANDADVLGSRAAMDAMTSAIRSAG